MTKSETNRSHNKVNEEKQQEASVVRPARVRLSVPQTVIGALVILVLGVGIGANTQAWNGGLRLFGVKPNVPELDLSSLETTYEALASKFDGTIDRAKLVDGANHGLVAAAGDQYTVYFNQKEATEFSSDLTGSFSGIGAELGLKDSVVTIISTLDGSPARNAGLKTGDQIVGVDGQSTEGWSLDKAVSQIRGNAGTSVKLNVVSGTDAREVSVTRAALTDPSVKGEIVDGVGILTISRFGEDTAALARDQANAFKKAGVKGVVLDLRGNGGGYVDAAQSIASLWLDNKVVVSERRGSTTVDTLRSGSNPILGGVKTVVLIDGGSASASEIVAGALRDNGAATLIGSKSFGKGSVQSVLDLAGGSELKVTVARWYTPGGKNIDKEGITPDTVITPTEEQVANGTDAVRDAALARF